MSMSNESVSKELASERHLTQISEALRSGMDTRGLFEMISTQFEIEAEEGNFTPERQAMFTAMLARLDRCIEVQPDDIAGKMVTIANLKEMQSAVAEARLTPSRRATTPVVAAGSYQQTLMAKFNLLQAWLGQQAIATNRGQYTNEALKELYIVRTGEIEQAILGAGDDAAARGVERELVRQFALEVKDTALAEHLTIADPIWPTPNIRGNGSGVFFSGFDDTLDLLQKAVETLDVGMMVMPQTTHGNPAEHRWNQMRAAAVCVFDMTRYASDGSSDGEHLRILATVGYELGIALTLGRPIIVLADPSRPLPFDIDVTPLLLHGNDNDTAAIMTALDDAIYKVQRTGGENSLRATRAQATALFSKHANVHVRTITQHAFDESHPDARRMRNVLDSIVDAIGPHAPYLLTPAWAGSYPSAKQQRCFHVTAFGPDWADSVSTLVQSCCAGSQQSIDYIRGDGVFDADIIRSIWNEICRATHVVVDVTGLNINALMELGMAHTLGRNVLLITQDDDFSAYPTSLRKQRFHHYAMTADGEAKLRETLQRFFKVHADTITDSGKTLDWAERRSIAVSPALSCSEAMSIRAHIDQVLTQDESSACGPLKAHVASMGAKLDADSLEVVCAYIDLVPACLEALYQVASSHNQLGTVQPILSTVAAYFAETDDLIADHHGLFGLLDDAYMAYTFMDQLNKEFVERQGSPLMDMDIAAVSQAIKPLLGETIVTTIDQHVQSTIEQTRMAQQLKTAGKWVLGGLAAAVAWNVLGGFGNSAPSNTDRAYDLLIADIYN